MVESQIRPLTSPVTEDTSDLKNKNRPREMILGTSTGLDDVDIMSIPSLETALFWGFSWELGT